MNSSVVQHSDPAPPTIKTPVCCLEALCKFCIDLEASLGQPIILLHIRKVGRLSEFYDFRLTGLS